MKNFVNSVKLRIKNLEHDIFALEAKIAEKKALLDKYQELLALEGGKLPKPAKKAVKGKTIGRKKVEKAGKKESKLDSKLPALIIDVLAKAKKPMRAREITDILTGKGWTTSASDPQMMVYKTLFRIEKDGKIVKADRGKFTLA